METDLILNKHYHLSTEPYFFIYRKDKYDSSIIRATLYDGERRVDDVRVSAHQLGIPERSHHWIIEYFEARLIMGLIK